MVNYTTAGTRYYACSVSDHCSEGKNTSGIAPFECLPSLAVMQGVYLTVDDSKFHEPTVERANDG